MAVQFPNFLGVPVQKPDFSGLSDIFENYYRGKGLKHQDNMNQFAAKEAPLDLLMKQVQAEFARPNAETALAGGKLGNQGKSLSNRQAEMTLQKLQKELKNQADIEASVKQAIAQGATGGGQGLGGGMGGGGSPNIMPMGNPPNMGGQAPSMASNAPQLPETVDSHRQMQNGDALQKGLMEVMQHQAMKNQPMPTQAPLMTDHPAESMNQPKGQNNRSQEISRGNPAWYGLDELWERNPRARDYIAKNYDKKEEKEEYDKKTGMTILRTKWPSGRRTVQTFMPAIEQDEGEDIPLSKSSMAKVEDEIRGADTLVPYLDRIIDMATPTKDLIKEKQNISKNDELRSKNADRLEKIDQVLKGRNTAGGIYNETELPYFASVFGLDFPSDASSKYHRIVNKALESYASSGKLPKTNESIERVHQILSRGNNESNKQFYDELVQERKEQIEKRARNVKLMKKGISRFGSSSLDPMNQSYSSSEWEPTNEK